MSAIGPVEPVNVLTSLLSTAAIIIGWFTARTLKKIDDNQTELFRKYNDINGRLSMLEGKHEAVVGQKGGHK